MSGNNGGPIWILGTGAFAPRVLPPLLCEKLSGVSTVFSHIVEDRMTWLPDPLIRAEFVSMAGEYTNVGNRFDNYSRVAHAILAAALAPAEVAYFTYGSPVVYDRVAGLIRELSIRHRIDCHVIPATSSVDSVLAFLGEDMAPGLQICEARWLVANKIQLDPHLSSLLFQVGVFWTDGIAQPADMSPDKLGPLQDYLLTQYPSFNPAIFVRAPLYFGDPGYARGTYLSELMQRGSASDLAGTSLYLPSVSLVARQSKLWWRMLFDPGEPQLAPRAQQGAKDCEANLESNTSDGA